MKKQYALSFLILLFSLLLLPTAAFARDDSVKTVDIIYSSPSKAESIYLSENGGETILGSINKKDDLSLKIPITSTGGVISGTVTVSSSGDCITPVSEVASLNISPGKTSEIPISVLIEKLPESDPVNVSFTVTFYYGKTSLSADFSLTLYPENADMGNYVFPTSATDATSLVNSEKSVLITKNSALLSLSAADGKIVLSTENFGKFPKGTAYITGDGKRHILFYDDYIKADGGQFIFIKSPSSLPEQLVADFASNGATLRQTVSFDYANDSPSLSFSDPNAVIVIPSGSTVDFMISDKQNVHDADWQKSSDGVDISYEIQKLENSVWIEKEFTLTPLPNTFGSDGNIKTEGKITVETGHSSPGTYRLYVTQKIGNITLSELYMPFFILNK